MTCNILVVEYNIDCNLLACLLICSMCVAYGNSVMCRLILIIEIECNKNCCDCLKVI